MRARLLPITLFCLSLTPLAPAQDDAPDTPEVEADNTPPIPNFRTLQRLARAMEAQPLVLIDAGAEERAMLRFAPEPGRQAIIDARLAIRLVELEDAMGTMQQTAIPDTMTRLACTVDEATDEGFTVAMEILSSEPIERDGVDPRFVDAMRPQLRGMVGRPWRITRAQNGLDAPDSNDDDATRAFREGLATSTRVRFPDEPVGVGARWRALAVTTNDERSITVQTITDYTLIERTDDALVIEVNARAFGLPDDPDDRTNTITELLSVATGTLTFDPALGLPSQGSIANTTWQTMRMIAPGQAQVLQQGATQTFTFSTHEELDASTADH